MNLFQNHSLSCNMSDHIGEPIKSICIRVDCNQQKKVNQLMKDLINLIEQTLNPMNQYQDSPNLTNLYNLGLLLREDIEQNIHNNVGKIKQDIKIVFEQFKGKLKMEMNSKIVLDWKNKGNALYDQQKYQEAIDCYDQAIKLDPKYINAWNNKGNALDELKKYEEVIQCYDQAIKLDPNYVNAWNGKGVALKNQQKYKEAIDCYDQAIKLNSRMPGTIKVKSSSSHLGNALYDQHKFQQAIDCYDQAIKLDHQFTQAIENLKITKQQLALNQ